MYRTPPHSRRRSELAAALLAVALIASGEAHAAIFQVTTSNDGGAGSLRAAIEAANASAGADSIYFSQLSVFTLRTIHLQSPLPSITGPTLLDATTAQWWTVRPMLRLDGQGLAQNDVGLDIASANVTVRGLQIVRMGGPGIRVRGANFVLTGSFVGTGGDDDLGNAGDGVVCIAGAGPITIGGTAENQGNLISGNAGFGIALQDGCLGGTILGNRIGSDEAGLVAVANGAGGVTIHGGEVQLGGIIAAATNLISGNQGHGVEIHGAAEGVVVAGNRIGPRITNATISQLHYIGNSGGGVVVIGSGATIGGTFSGAGNLIYGNQGDAIRLEASSSGALVQGNRTGFVFAPGAEVGNGGNGIRIHGDNHQIGGTTPGAANTILASHGSGILIEPPATGNRIEGNWIGTTAADVEAWGHSGSGVLIDGASGNTVGGERPGAGNVIAWNMTYGIWIASGSSNRILGNLIHDNGEAIALGESGPEPNDYLDADGGSNLGQNFPYLLAAPLAEGGAHVTGRLEAAPSTAYRIEIFSAAACGARGTGESEAFVAADWVATDAGGNATIDLVLPGVHDGAVLSGTATDPLGNTSSLSPCLRVGEPWPGKLYIANAAFLIYEGMGEAPVTILRAGGFAGMVGGTFRTEDFEATAPADYLGVEESFTMSGSGIVFEAQIPIVFDLEHEPGESFLFGVEEPVGGVELDWESEGYGHIVDNYTNAPFYQVMDDVVVVEGNGGVRQAVFTVRVTGAMSTVSVGYTTIDGTAIAGSDFVETSGTLSFEPGGGTQTVAVPILDDFANEVPESFRFQLQAFGNVVCWQCGAWGTIFDDDPTGVAGGLRFAASSRTVDPGAGTIELTVERVGGGAGAVTVAFETVDGTAIAGSDYLPSAGELAWADGETEPKSVELTILDASSIGSRRFAVRLSDPLGGATLVAPAIELVEIVHPAVPLFTDDFEAGDCAAWSGGAC